MAELKVNDAGTWRTAAQVQVNDGGTWRGIQDIKVNDGGVWRTVFQYLLLDTTMSAEGSGPDGGGGTFYGYINGVFGSMSSATLSDGKTLITLVDDDDGSNPIAGIMEISGFSSDPLTNYFSTVVVGGVSLASSAAAYSYLAGVARWDWFGAGAFGLDGSGSSTVVINP
tara:strand:+ start:147 stop:653 length:507 start_codon:yes stop_codon:yes gene_type:complete